MKKSLLMALAIACIAILVPAAVLAAPTTDRPEGTQIISSASNNTLNFRDSNGNTRETVTGTQCTTVVTWEFGFNPNIGSPTHLDTTPGVKVSYAYTVTNEGNATDVYALTIDDIAYSDVNTKNWTVLIRDAGDTYTTSELGCLEDETKVFKVTVTPSTAASEAANNSYADVRVKVATSRTPVGEYIGANGNRYGGTSEAKETSRTTIKVGVMTLSRVATVDAPDEYVAQGGKIHDAVPGSIITYVLTYNNTGNKDCQNVIIADMVPDRATNTYAIHVNRNDTTEVSSINGGTQGSGTGWEVFYTNEGGANVKDWNSSTGNWVSLGTLTTGTEEFNLSTNVVAIKWQKATVTSLEGAKTLTWGVVIM